MKKGEVIETIFHHKNMNLKPNDLGLLFGNKEKLYFILQNNTKIDSSLFSKFENLLQSNKLVVIYAENLSPNILEFLEHNPFQNIDVLPQSYVAQELGEILLEYLMKPDDGPIKIDGSTTKQVNEGYIKPSLTLEDAMKLSSKLGSVVNAEFRLIPYYIVDYITSLSLDEVSSSETITGTVRIDGITGESSEVSGELKTTPNIDWTHHKFEPKFDCSLAMQKAKSAIIENKTRIMEIERDLGSAKVYEKKRVAPNDKDIILKYRGMIYWPIWYLECAQGIIVIDSTSSSIIQEEIFKH